MNKKFGFENVEEVKSRIDPGVEEIQFTGVVSGINDNQKEYLEFGVVSIDGSRDHTERFYFTTEKGIKISLQRIKSILKVVLGDEKAKGNYDVSELNAMLSGKKARVLFASEEYEYNGEVRAKTSFAFSGFIEALSVSKEDSKLKFNPAKHIKRLPVAPSQKAAAVSNSDINDDLF